MIRELILIHARLWRSVYHSGATRNWEVGDDIYPSIQLEYECPSMHEDKKLPVLDLKMWILALEGDRVRLLHEFYRKAVASSIVVHSRSPLPWSTKRIELTQEVLRVLLRCSPELPWTIL